jgi:3-deoxy-7-phosphoheptulonate synthase
MLIIMRHGAEPAEIQRVCDTIEEMGYQSRPMPGRQRTTVGLVGNDGRVDGSRIAALPTSPSPTSRCRGSGSPNPP